MPEDYDWLVRNLEPEVQDEYLRQKRANEAGAAAYAEAQRQAMIDRYAAPNLTPEDLAIIRAMARDTYDVSEYARGGIVPQFGGANMNGISMSTQPARRRIRPGDMRGSGIGMGSPRNTFPMPLQDRSGITMAQTAPAYAPAPGSTDTVPAMLTPGEGVLNTGAMSMMGEPALNALNRYGRGIQMQEGGVVDERSEEELVAAGHTIYHPKTQDEADALPAGAYFKTPSGELLRVQPQPRGISLQDGGVVQGFEDGGRVRTMFTGWRNNERNYDANFAARTGYPMGPYDVHTNMFPVGSRFSFRGVGPYTVREGSWRQVGGKPVRIPRNVEFRDQNQGDYADPKEFNPLPPEDWFRKMGGVPAFGRGEGGGTGGGGWGGGGDWGAGGVPGGGGPPPGQVSISAPGMSGPEVMEWAPGFNWKPWLTKGDPNAIPTGMAGGGVAGRPASWGTGKPTRDLIGMGIGGVSNLVFPGLGFITSPLARWLTQKIQSGNWSSGSFIPPPNVANKPSGGAPPGQTTPPLGAAPVSGGGGGIERGFEGLGGGGFEPLAGAGVGTIGMGGSLGPASGYGSQGQYWKPWLTRGYLPSNPGQGVATGGIVMEGGVVPSFQEGGTVHPIGYTDPIEEAEWQKVIPMLPPNTDVGKLKQSGIDPQMALKLFGSVYGGFAGAGTSPTGYNDLAAGGGA